MMVTLRRRADRAPFAPVVAAMFGLAGAVVAAALDLPMTSKLGAMAGAFAALGAIAWAIAIPVGRAIEGRGRGTWRDEGYDAPIAEPERRRPIFAPDELGAPLMSDAALMLPTVAAPEADPVADAETPIADLIARLEARLTRRGGDDPDPAATAEPLPLSSDWILPDNDQPAASGPDDGDEGTHRLRRLLGRMTG